MRTTLTQAMNQNKEILFDLRSLNPKDTEELFALTIKNKNHLKKFLNWIKDDYSIDDTKKFIVESIEKEIAGKMLPRAIINNNKIIGMVGLNGINQDKSAEIGYWIDKNEQGKGIVTEATKIIITQGFNELNLNRIGLRCAVINTKSCAIPKRLDFKKEGILRQSVLVENKFLDMEIWSILKDEWKLSTAAGVTGTPKRFILKNSKIVATIDGAESGTTDSKI